MNYAVTIICVLLSGTCFASSQKQGEEKFKNVAITEHPTKGSFTIEFGKPIVKPPAYEIDYEECTKKVYSNGVVVNGVTVIDYETLKNYESDANKANLEAFAALAKREKYNKDTSIYKEADRIIKDRLKCMKDLGWTNRIEKVPL